MERLIVGICGGTGSGKSTLADRIYRAFGDSAVHIEMDSYYKTFPELSYEERTKLNYDHPDIIDAGLMVRQLTELKNGGTVTMPVYDFTRHLRSEETRTVSGAPLILVEGILLFYFRELREMCDIKIFVDTDADERILRRAWRDVNERGRSLESVMGQYLATVKPMHEQYVEAWKYSADIIVPNGGKNKTACDIITDTIEKRLGIEKKSV